MLLRHKTISKGGIRDSKLGKAREELLSNWVEIPTHASQRRWPDHHGRIDQDPELATDSRRVMSIGWLEVWYSGV